MKNLHPKTLLYKATGSTKSASKAQLKKVEARELKISCDQFSFNKKVSDETLIELRIFLRNRNIIDETEFLLSSKKTKDELLQSIADIKKGKGKVYKDLDEFKSAFNIKN